MSCEMERINMKERVPTREKEQCGGRFNCHCLDLMNQSAKELFKSNIVHFPLFLEFTYYMIKKRVSDLQGFTDSI